MASRQLGHRHHDLDNHDNVARIHYDETEANHDDSRGDHDHSRVIHFGRSVRNNDNGRGGRIHLDRVGYFDNDDRVVVNF